MSNDAQACDVISEDDNWKRSKWLTGWLWFMLIMTAFNIPVTFLMTDAIIAQNPKLSPPLIYTLIVLSVISVLSLVLIFKQKLIGVWLFAFVMTSAFLINFYSMGLVSALFGLTGAAILFFLLKKGGANSAWSRLS
ncbi:hypothetical protein [Shewanella baltica]|uniref:hypothetical protein n=1 Tax=Shewanella baltica TaxID=62322 RepID=UPI00217D3998|nr:hypothetical protein [Shewanella baltica]MCS6160361.1 hypothetical protein [Shewanella baltica]